MRRYAAFALTALLLLALLGCGGGASIVGKWTDEADYGAAVIEFTRDGQVKTYSPLMPDLSITMAYKVNGSDITMTAEGEDTVSSTGTLSGGGRCPVSNPERPSGTEAGPLSGGPAIKGGQTKREP